MAVAYGAMGERFDGGAILGCNKSRRRDGDSGRLRSHSCR